MKKAKSPLSEAAIGAICETLGELGTEKSRPILHKLEKQGVIESYEEIEKGRTRRYYRLTPDGKVALERELAEWEQFAHAVNVVLGEA